MFALLFLTASILAALSYFFGKEKLHPIKLLLSIWLLAMGVAQLGFSKLEQAFTSRYYGILTLCTVLIIAGSYIAKKRSNNTHRNKTTEFTTLQKKIFWYGIGSIVILSIISNIHIYTAFGTLPLLNIDPERLRFSINRLIFGGWEYFALAARIYIPLIFTYFFITKKTSWTEKGIGALFIIIGVIELLLYTSRSTVVFATLFTYFIYLILNINNLTKKKVIISSVIAVGLVAVFTVAIPAVRHYISFSGQYHGEGSESFKPFAYYYDIAQLTIPQQYGFLASPYLALSFNQQALNQTFNYYNEQQSHYLGRFHLSTFSSGIKLLGNNFEKVQVPWVDIFLPWWNTATFIFSYYADFGLLGVIVGTLFWGYLLSLLYYYTKNNQKLSTVILFAYFNFVIIMSVYTNYTLREEFYIDVVLLLAFTLAISKTYARKTNPQT